MSKDAAAPVANVPAPLPATSNTTKLVPLTMIQKAMFRQMTKSLTIPHFGYSDEIVLNELAIFRDSINAYLKHSRHNTYKFKKITYMPIFLKALSLSLNEFPILNSCIINADDLSKAQLQFRSSHNIGIAMDTPNG